MSLASDKYSSVMDQQEHTAVIQLHLTGSDISPGKMRSKDLAVVMTAVEEMISSYISAKHPEVKGEEVMIALETINEGSLTLNFKPNVEEYSISAIQDIAGFIEKKRINELPFKTRKSIQEIRNIAFKRKFNAEFYTINGSKDYLTSINSSVEIPVSSNLRGETTLYGTIIRVGGQDPTVMIKTIDGETLYCAAKSSVVRQAGKKLYETVGVRGEAEWDIETMRIKEFTILEFTEYEDIPVDESFSELSSKFGKKFNLLGNANNFVAELRKED